MKYFSSNLTYLREKQEKKQHEMAFSLGLGRTQLANYERGYSKPDLETLIRIAGYFRLKIDDLLNTDLRKSSNLTEGNLKGNLKGNPSLVEEGVAPYNKGGPTKAHPVIVTVDEGGRDNIVMVDTRAAAGYPDRYLEPEFIGELPAFKLPDARFRNGTFRCFEVQGDSMYDTLSPGEWVVCRYLDNGFSDIRDGYVHVVVTRDEVSVKRLLNHIEDSGSIVLISDNEAYPDREIHASEVLELWRCLAHLSFSFINKRDTLARIREDILDIRHELAILKGKRR